MSVNLAVKKSNYVLDIIVQAQAMKLASDNLVLAAAKWSNQFNTGQNAAIVDADLLVSTGTAHMTQAQLNTFWTCQAAIAAAISNNLQSLLAILPQ